MKEVFLKDALSLLKRFFSKDRERLATIKTCEQVNDVQALINYLGYVESEAARIKEGLGFKTQYKLYDIVRPTDEWIENEISSWLSEMKKHEVKVGDEEMKNLEDAREKFKMSVAYISEIYHGQYSVSWLAEFNVNYFVFKNSWWYNGDFIVLGNALKICKDVI